MHNVALFVAGEKGLRALESVLFSEPCKAKLTEVITARDAGVENDFCDEIVALVNAHGFQCRVGAKAKAGSSAEHLVAIGWRWMILDIRPLIIFHDSLLPRYRGFNPLVTALINGDDRVGVTAIDATGEFDEGDILLQQSVSISYPMKIREAIQRVSVLYSKMLVELLLSDDIWRNRVVQSADDATYSLWRDEEDYRIDWGSDSHRIARMVDAVGEPYRGAVTNYNGHSIRVLDVTPCEDLILENRMPGKLLRIKDNRPEVVCGSGMVRIDRAVYDGTDKVVVFDKLRIRMW